MKMRSLFIQVSLIALLCAMFTGNILGQLGMATLGGTVTDPSGAVVPGAQVTLKNVARQEEREGVTNSTGQYVFSAVLPGSYELSVTADGFQTRLITEVILTSGQGSTINVKLSVPTTKQQVTVTAAPPLLQSTTATVGSVVSSQQFVSLPMINRDFTDVLATLPAVAMVANPDAYYSLSGPLGTALNPAVLGQRQRDNNFILDGVENTMPLFSQIAILPPPEAIAEMKVETGPDSGAVGWASGATINIVTKSGTSQIHGDLWEYLKNNDLDARSFFQTSIGGYQYNDFGGTLGGPLVIPHVLSKAKAWYVFGYYEGLRVHSAGLYQAEVPTAAEVDGNLAGLPQVYNPYTTVLAPDGSVASRQPFAGNIIPSSDINSVAQAVLKSWYPLPNFPVGLIPGVNYERTAPSITDSDQWNVRADHQFSPKDTVYGRYTDWRLDNTGTSFPTISSLNHQRVTDVAVGDTHVLSPTSVVTGRLGMLRIGTYGSSFQSGDLSKTQGFLSAFPAFEGTYNVLPTLDMEDQIFPEMGESYSANGPEYYWSATVDSQLIRSRHTLGFGFGWIRTSIFTGHTFGYEDYDPTQTALGTGTGSGLASFLLGLPADAYRQAGNNFGDYFGNEYSLYAQDTFRATAKLTLNLGLRWDFAQVLHDKFGMGSYDWVTGQYYFDKTNPITGAAPNIQPGGAPPDYDGFQPRFGIAYMVNPETVIRSSYGIFDDLYGVAGQAQTSDWGNWPFSYPQTVNGLNPGLPTAFITNPFPGPPVGTTVPTGIDQGFNIERSSTRNPYVQQWSLSVQRQIKPSLSAQVAYFGSHGVRLSSQITDNVAAEPGTTPLATRQKEPTWPVYVLNNYNESSSWYNGLIVELKKRLSHNLSLQVSYSWSHTLSNNDSMGIGAEYGMPYMNPNRFDMQDFKGPAGYDIRHIFSAAYVYEIPYRPTDRFAKAVLGNWELSGIVSADSGIPYWIVLDDDNENIGWSGRYYEFPNVTCNPQANITPSINEWFNTSCYQVPAYGTAGDAGRKGLTADGLFNWNAAFVKNWPMKEGRNLELRGEFYNLPLNTTFNPPYVYAGTADFGQLTNGTRNGGRTIQFALKFHF